MHALVEPSAFFRRCLAAAAAGKGERGDEQQAANEDFETAQPVKHHPPNVAPDRVRPCDHDRRVERAEHVVKDLERTFPGALASTRRSWSS
jgi:hypothetical protein